MSIIDNIRTMFAQNPAQQLEKQKVKKILEYKRRLLVHCTYNELMKIAKSYISNDPHVIDVNHQGIEKKRKPTKIELEDTLMEQAPLEEIKRIIPRLKKIE